MQSSWIKGLKDKDKYILYKIVSIKSKRMPLYCENVLNLWKLKSLLLYNGILLNRSCENIEKIKGFYNLKGS